MKYSSLICSIFLVLPASATITLQYTDFSNALTGISDSAGTSPVNGLTWGIIIDTDGDGLPTEGGEPALIGSLGLNLKNGADLGSNDLFIFGGATIFWPLGPESGNGSITTANDMDPYAFSAEGVSANDPFYLIWFNTGIVADSVLAPGTNYGLIEKGEFLLPGDGTPTTSYASLFAGEDPIRAAEFQLVPEPSTMFLCIVSGASLLRRRRASSICV